MFIPRVLYVGRRTRHIPYLLEIKVCTRVSTYTKAVYTFWIIIRRLTDQRPIGSDYTVHIREKGKDFGDRRGRLLLPFHFVRIFTSWRFWSRTNGTVSTVGEVKVYIYDIIHIAGLLRILCNAVRGYLFLKSSGRSISYIFRKIQFWLDSE